MINPEPAGRVAPRARHQLPFRVKFDDCIAGTWASKLTGSKLYPCDCGQPRCEDFHNEIARTVLSGGLVLPALKGFKGKVLKCVS